MSKNRNKGNGYTTLQNIRYIVADSWRFEKLIFIYFGLFTVLSAISPFIGIFFPKFILGGS